MQQQIRRLDIGTFFGQFFDGIAAIAKNPFVAVNVGNFALTRRGVGERGVVTHQTEIVSLHFYRPQIDGANRIVLDWNLDLLAGAIIGDRKSVARRLGRRLTAKVSCRFGGIHAGTFRGGQLELAATHVQIECTPNPLKQEWVCEKNRIACDGKHTLAYG